MKYEAEFVGGALPGDVLRTRTGQVTVGPGAPATVGARGADVSAAGGTMTVAVRATINGVARSATTKTKYKILAGDNPPRNAVADVLSTLYTAQEQPWMLRVTCLETGRRQFYSHAGTRAQPGAYVYPGEPVMNHGGDGGAGLCQITDPPAGAAALWDWRANVRASRAAWTRQRETVVRYVAAVRRLIARLASEPGDNMVTRAQAARRSGGLEPVTAFVVPDLTDDQLIESIVRGFNGFAGRSPFVSFGLMEFDLATTGAPPTRRVVVDTPADGRTGILRWERVPVHARPASGDPNYVEHVRNTRCAGD